MHWPKDIVSKSAIEHISKLSSSIINLHDKKCSKEPKKWDEDFDLSSQLINFEAKIVEKNPNKKKKDGSKSSSLDSSFALNTEKIIESLDKNK